MAKVTYTDVVRADVFLAMEKRLSAQEPGWFKLQNGRWAANWPVMDINNVVLGSLSFRVDPKYQDYPCLSLIHENRTISRLDLAPPHIVKPNPPWALALPGMVKGNHVHAWPDNRDRIFTTGNWLLQARRPVEPAVKRVPHMLRWFADHINLTLYPPQHSFDYKPDADLLSGAGV